jgi:hypothetical protein
MVPLNIAFSSSSLTCVSSSGTNSVLKRTVTTSATNPSSPPEVSPLAPDTSAPPATAVWQIVPAILIREFVGTSWVLADWPQLVNSYAGSARVAEGFQCRRDVTSLESRRRIRDLISRYKTKQTLRHFTFFPEETRDRTGSVPLIMTLAFPVSLLHVTSPCLSVCTHTMRESHKDCSCSLLPGKT